MGQKSRTFTGTIRSTILKTLRADGAQSKDELLARVRADPKLAASVRKLEVSIGQLLADGQVVQTGQRAHARFELVR